MPTLLILLLAAQVAGSVGLLAFGVIVARNRTRRNVQCLPAGLPHFSDTSPVPLLGTAPSSLPAEPGPSTVWPPA